MLLLRKLISKYKKFKKDKEAATAIEYALVVAIISIGLIAVMGNLKNSISKSFSIIGSQVSSATG
jgi:pilus assembly protein Flp/PilA